jgi:hypothetical protein
MYWKKVAAHGLSINKRDWLRFEYLASFRQKRREVGKPAFRSQFPTLRIELFGCFETSALAEAHARATAIFVDEFDATQGQGAP